ncbi:MAG: DUF502 domain-containing protein [Planctomycetes bacterium]|jgi:uncharacterized membrane protein|nr:DUF502 domain-containing protein [Planctomycetota bacterium]
MKTIWNHLARCFLAGVVALLPIAGAAVTVGYLEASIADSGISKLPFYFPGFGLLAAAALVYLIGLAVSTVVGRWAWSRADRLLDRLPGLGSLYQTVKQVLGYGEGKDAVFLGVVMVPSRDLRGEEIGLVTSEIGGGPGPKKLVVFVPAAPSPASGRLLIVDEAEVRRVPLPVSDALKALLSVGKVPLPAGSVL